MKATTLLVTLLVFATVSPIAVSEGQSHPAEHSMQLSLDHGRKWATDEPLRAGMTEIQNMLRSNLDALRDDKLTVDQYRALGTAIDQRVHLIIKQCKLEPRADAMLHIIIIDLLAGSEAMQGKGGMSTKTGVHKAMEALNAYGDYFDHPGWRRLPW